MLTKWCYITLHALHTLHTLHHITSHHITLHHITLHYITLHQITLDYMILHYIRLYDITYIYMYIYMYYVNVHVYVCIYIYIYIYWDLTAPISAAVPSYITNGIDSCRMRIISPMVHALLLEKSLGLMGVHGKKNMV